MRENAFSVAEKLAPVYNFLFIKATRVTKIRYFVKIFRAKSLWSFWSVSQNMSHEDSNEMILVM